MDELKKELEYAWAAGFLDGEGCIRVAERKLFKSQSQELPCYNLIISVSGCHRESLEKLTIIFGLGNVYAGTAASDKQNASYRWRATGPDAIQVIRLVLPYLITKSAEAKAALRMEPLMVKMTKATRLNITARRQEIYEELRELKPTARFRKLISQ